MSRFAGLLGDPGPGGVGGDSGDVHAAAAALDHHQDVEAAQEDDVDVGEVDGEDRLGLRGEELSPGRAGPSRCRVEAGSPEDRPYRVGFQNSGGPRDLRFQAAAWYSLIKPPRIGRRRILPRIGSGTGASGHGGRNSSDRCGRFRL
jgi:hypothetical protein